MARTRYIGSTRVREAGFSATHKQDFVAHVTGGDWIHLASTISVTGSYATVQAELDSIESRIGVLNNTIVNIHNATNNAVVIFDGTTGKVVKQSLNPLCIDPDFGDLLFPSNTGYNVISSNNANSVSAAQNLMMFGQANTGGGAGGNLILGSGYNFTNSSYDGKIMLYTSNLSFLRTQTNPVITQEDAAGVPTNLYIRSQSTTSNATPSNLWLESGTNFSGYGGNIYLSTWPGFVHVTAAGLVLDRSYVAEITHEAFDTVAAHDMYISAQSIAVGAVYSNGIPGNLWLQSGQNTNNDTAGNVCINAYSGFINLFTSQMQFGPLNLNPIISQMDNSTVGQTLTIQAQNSLGNTGGNLLLSSGSGVWDGSRYLYGNININANTGIITIGDLINGGGISILSDQHIDITSNSNSIYIGKANGSASISLYGSVFFPNIPIEFVPSVPTSGVFLWSFDGQLFCMGPNGETYQLNLTPVTMVS